MTKQTASNQEMPLSGLYRHYKGRDYEVIDTARHSETGEELVVYRCLYGDYSLWVRPLAMFLESVEVNGESIPRFSYLGPAAESRADGEKGGH